MKERIGVLGSGPVAQALGKGFLGYDYPVMLGTRDTAKLEQWKSEQNGDLRLGSFHDAAHFGEIVVLACKGTAAFDVLNMAGADNLAGKVILDTTNPIADAPPVNGVLQYTTSINESLMEQLQAAHPTAMFVKAFSLVGNSLMVNPDFGGLLPTMFICGNDEQARKKATEILELFGWEVEDLGMAEAARAIEPLAILWCIPGFLRNQWQHALKLLR